MPVVALSTKPLLSAMAKLPRTAHCASVAFDLFSQAASVPAAA
jgi:hypothetical protein